MRLQNDGRQHSRESVWSDSAGITRSPKASHNVLGHSIIGLAHVLVSFRYQRQSHMNVEPYAPPAFQITKIRASLAHWIDSELDPEWWITANFNRQTNLQRARKSLNHLGARIDHYCLGRAWSSKARKDRFLAVGFFENVSTNLHAHLLARLPSRRGHEAVWEMPRMWEKIESAGSLWIASSPSAAGAVRYSTKKFHAPDHGDRMIIIPQEA